MIVMKTASNFQYMQEITTTFVRVATPGPTQSDVGVAALVPHPAPDVPAGPAGSVAIMSEARGDAGLVADARWYDGSSRDNYIHRSWMKRGLPDDVFSGKPMIGICNSASELTPVQPTPRRPGRARQAGRLGSGWRAARVPRDVAGRDLDPADGDVAAKPDGDGRRGVVAMQSARRRRAAVGMRQDDAGDAHGGRVGGPPRDHADRWADADRASPRASPSAPRPTCGA